MTMIGEEQITNTAEQADGVVPGEAQTASPAESVEPDAEDRSPDDLLPREIVERLDQYIIGQEPAKRAVAIALRNRVRRRKLPDEMRQEVLPKNILMIGPTGVGKTEIARRLAKLTSSPFIKVEATKFTEVGYVGRDVESIIRDLLEQTITEVQDERIADVEDQAKALAEKRIVEAIVNAEIAEFRKRLRPAAASENADVNDQEKNLEQREARRRRQLTRTYTALVADQKIEERVVEIEVEEPYQPPFEGFVGPGLEEVGYSLSDFFSQMAPPRRRSKRISVADARIALTEEETDRLIDLDRVYDDAIRDIEEAGIVFIDEIDKICGPAAEHGPDVSGEGVQRDLLPLLEGSTVHTRYGSIHTDHILFIAAGAFNVARPSDLIPEFQGRFPIRVELSPLTEDDMKRILTEPNNALTKQYAALLSTENVDLVFGDDGIAEIAIQAARVNAADEDIGARRLFTILERVLEDLSYAAEDSAGQRVVVDRHMVQDKLEGLVASDDFRRYIL